jgi:hypothetical protein
MPDLLNGKAQLAKAVGWATLLGGVAILVGWYAGWRQNVEAAVIDRQMLIRHEAAMEILDDNVRLDAVQQTRIEKIEKAVEDLAVLMRQHEMTSAESHRHTNDLIQLLVQSQMKEGKINR